MPRSTCSSPYGKIPYGSYSRAEEKLHSHGIIRTSVSMVAGAKKSMSVLDVCLKVDCCWTVSLPLKFPTSEAFRKHLFKDLCGLSDVYVGMNSHWRHPTKSWDFLRAPSLPWRFSLNLTWDTYSCGTCGINWPTG